MASDTTDASGLVERLDRLEKFLKGEGALDYCWFGDTKPTARGAFWWRNEVSAVANSIRLLLADNATHITTLTARVAEQDAEIARLREAVSRAETTFKVIAGSHCERFGMCQTDVEEIPDLTADEAMRLARDWLSFDDYPAIEAKP